MEVSYFGGQGSSFLKLYYFLKLRFQATQIETKRSQYKRFSAMDVSLFLLCAAQYLFVFNRTLFDIYNERAKSVSTRAGYVRDFLD